MHRGGVLRQAQLAFETWGSLDARRSNAVFVFTGMSPGAHAASSALDPEPGWWEALIGPGRAIDTRRWFVICANSLGSCKGSTGPAALDPDTGTPYRLRFPELAIEDIAAASLDLVDGLGIETLQAVIGPSMGGMTALAFLKRAPGRTRHAVLISTTAASPPLAIALRSLQREIVQSDPAFADGAYPDPMAVRHGMGLARKLGVITYRSGEEWDQRFGRARLDRSDAAPFAPEFQIESYLEAHAQRWGGHFDPCSYLYLSRAMDRFELAGAGQSLDAACAELGLTSALVIGVTTDLLFPLSHQETIARALAAAGTSVRFHALPSVQGHDAFLVDVQRFAPLLADYFDTLAE